MEGESHERPQTAGRRTRRMLRISWLIIERLFDIALDAIGEYLSIIRREAELFLGVALTLAALLDFQNGKNCDGNTADYLSCTRPSTFYYYSWWQIALVVIGVFLLMIWFLRLRRHAREQY